MPKLSVLTREIKKFAKNRNVSDEEFLNNFLNPLVEAAHIHNKNNEQFYLNKTRTSWLLNGVKDVPKVLREALSRVDLETQMIDGMDLFISDYLEVKQEKVLKERLFDLLDDEDILKLDRVKMESISLSHLLVKLLLISIEESNLNKEKRNVIWKRGINCVEVITGDLFKYGFGNRSKTKNIIVIPVNTAFDTHVTRCLEKQENPLVAETTIHGQWLTRIQKSGVNEDDLYERIVTSLENQNILSVKREVDSNGRKEVFPIGSIAIIENKNATYFLLAIADFDDYNIAHSTVKNIDFAVKKLLEKYNSVGQGYNLYLPLLGTGRSRTGLSIKEAYELLKDAFMARTNMIQGHIIVVVRPEDSDEIDILK